MLGEKDSKRQNQPVPPFVPFELEPSLFPSAETTGEGEHWTGNRDSLVLPGSILL